MLTKGGRGVEGSGTITLFVKSDKKTNSEMVTLSTNGLCWQNLGDLGKKSDFWPMDRFFLESKVQKMKKKSVFAK